MSAFDVEAFQNMTIDEANETESTPVPEGDYDAIIDKVRVKTIKIKSGAREGQEVPVLEVTFQINDDSGELKSLLNREKVTTRYDIWLDLNDNGTLGFGPNQNVGLGRLREAVNMNKPGKPFMFPHLEGQGPVRIHVSNEAYNERVYDKVTRVSKPE